MESCHFTLSMPIRWGDQDALGHVNHTKYLTYFEHIRVAWWASIGISLNEAEGPILIHAEATYLKALKSPTDVTAKLYAHSPGKSSYWIDYELFEGDILAARGKTKVVWVNYAKNQSVPLPNTMLKALAADLRH